MPSVAEVAARHGRRRSRFPYGTVIVVLVIIGASAGALSYFSSAKIEVLPDAASAAVQGSFTAGGTAEELPFKLVTAQKEAVKTVKATGTKNVTSSASGMITISNTGATAQTLRATTRFATPAGLIFRIREGVKVPGGSAAKPGTVTAKVYADQPGASYNVGPSSFTVPGFAGTPQAEQVTAKSAAAMTGGASGTVPSVDPAEEASARAELRTALAPDLEKILLEQIPAGYVFVAGSATTTYQAAASAPGESATEAQLKEQGTITAVVFPNAALAKAIGMSVSDLNYQGAPLTLSGVESLKLTPAGAFPGSEEESFSFTLSGTAPLVYSVDTARIAAAVAGKTKSAAEVALTNYPEVSRAIIILRPFWRQSFPEDPAAITVTVQNP